jgi:hypothetical protein
MESRLLGPSFESDITDLSETNWCIRVSHRSQASLYLLTLDDTPLLTPCLADTLTGYSLAHGVGFIQILSSPPNSYETLGKLCNLSKPPSSPSGNSEPGNRTCTLNLWGTLNKTSCSESLTLYLGAAAQPSECECSCLFC